ncbi:MAG: LysR family transcriptional regulator [Rhodocyclaceae bacterium]|nr:LysR family transcriptional regulator [Rhodocyclaceae bacterium]
MNLDANDLILFAAVVDAGSFSRAAEQAGLPKSTLSRRLTQLEAKLGERLLTRTTRRLTLTEFGERILEHARRLQEEADAAAALAQHRQATPRGVLRVSLVPAFAELDMAQFLLQFAARYPEVRLELDLSPRRVDLLAERYDLALRAASRLPDDATLVACKLCEMHNGLYASPAYLRRYGTPRAPEDLLQGHVGLRLIGGSGEVLPWQLADGRREWTGIPDGAFAANSLELLRDLAAHGTGIVGLSDRHVRGEWLTKGLLQRVLPDWHLPTVTLWSVTPGRRLLPARTRAFVDMLREALAEG